MNKIFLMGRLTRDPEIRYSKGDKPIAIARYCLAVDKKQKREDGITADFFNVVAFGKDAENISEYFQKGSRIHVQGHIEQRKYEKDGVNQLWYSIVVEHWEFCERRKEAKEE